MKSLKLNITDSKLKVNEIRQSRNNKNVTEMLVLPEKTTTTKLMIKAFNKIQHLFMIKKKKKPFINPLRYRGSTSRHNKGNL